jgi:hypothetical protein
VAFVDEAVKTCKERSLLKCRPFIARDVKDYCTHVDPLVAVAVLRAESEEGPVGSGIVASVTEMFCQYAQLIPSSERHENIRCA